MHRTCPRSCYLFLMMNSYSLRCQGPWLPAGCLVNAFPGPQAPAKLLEVQTHFSASAAKQEPTSPRICLRASGVPPGWAGQPLQGGAPTAGERQSRAVPACCLKPLPYQRLPLTAETGEVPQCWDGLKRSWRTLSNGCSSACWRDPLGLCGNNAQPVPLP